MPFPQAPARARRILGGWRRSGWLWCCGRSCWWFSRRITKRSSPAGSRRGRKGAVREGYKITALLLKPSLGIFGLVGRHRVLLPHQGITTLFSISRYTLVLTFKPISKMWGGMMWSSSWNHTKDHNRSRKLCFHHPGHVPVIRGNPDLHFERARNGPVVITWIVREHELYNGASPTSLVEQCHFQTW